MFEIKNMTPFDTGLHLCLDLSCQEHAVVVIKGEYKISASKNLELQEDKPCIQLVDDYRAEPQNSSLRRASDMVPFKHFTDVAFNGFAYSPGRACQFIDLQFDIAGRSLRRRVFGDRYWESHRTTWAPSAPEFFVRQAIGFEQAFGGSHFQNDKLILAYGTNPVGKGLGRLGEPVYHGLALPNIELPQQQIQRPSDQPPPAALGFVAPHWSPRTSFAGTYDAAWQEQRAPLLPLDFQESYYNAAIAELQLPYLHGGELVCLRNLSEEGLCSFVLPSWHLVAHFAHKGTVSSVAAVLDTVLIEPDEQAVFITWRAQFNCKNQGVHLRQVVIEGYENG